MEGGIDFEIAILFFIPQGVKNVKEVNCLKPAKPTLFNNFLSLRYLILWYVFARNFYTYLLNIVYIRLLFFSNTNILFIFMKDIVQIFLNIVADPYLIYK